ncbi:MAG: TOBE domain-containing protein [Hyphomicrobiales bacterium]
MASDETSRPGATLTLTDNAGGRASEDRIRLLEAIGATGSISAAAKSVGLSYKAAWESVNVFNNLFPKPLVVAKAGGRTGGGAALTPEGRQVIDAFHLLSGEMDRFLGRLAERLAGGDGVAGGGRDGLAALMWSLMMRTSARNTFRGTVSAVTPGAVNAEVRLRISETQEIVAIVTNRSVESLGLAAGRPAFALIKASFIILAPETEALRTSARNRLCGRIIERTEGAVNDEVVVDLGEGRTLAAIVTSESAQMLELSVGKRVCALIKASHVILAVD